MKSKLNTCTLLLFFIFCFGGLVFSQTKMDKLEQDFENLKDDSKRLEIIHQIINRSISPGLTLKYASYAEKILQEGDIKKQSIIIGAKQDIARAYFLNKDGEKAESLVNESIQLSESKNYRKGIVKGLNLLSFFNRLKEPEKAGIFAKQALFVANDANDNEGYVEACSNILAVNQEESDLANYTKEARKLVQSVNDKVLLADFYHNIGIYEFRKNANEQAKHDFEIALQNALEVGNKKLIVEILIYLGKVKSKFKDKQQEGLEHLFQAYVISREYSFKGNQQALYKALRAIANTYEGLENLTTSSDQKKSEEYRLLKEGYFKKSRTLKAVGFDINKYIKKVYGRRLTSSLNTKIVNRNIETKNQELLNEINRQKRLINNLLEANNILARADKNVRLQHEEDSILVLKKNKTIEELKADLEDKKRENISLISSQKNHEEEISNTRNYWLLWLILAILMGVLGILFFVFKNRRSKAEANENKSKLINYKERINRQENEIRESQDAIRLKQEQLAATNAKLDDAQQHNIAIQQVLLEELKTPVTSVIAQTQKEKPINRLLIHATGKQMLNVLDCIEVVENYEKVEIRLYKESFSLYKVAKEVIKENEVLIIEKGLNVRNDIKPYLYADFDREVITKVFHNFLANSLKYTPLGGELVLTAKVLNEEGQYFIEVCLHDNGKIIPSNLQKQVFKKFSFEEARPSGMGLVFNKLMVEEHGGKVSVASTEGQGTAFYFTLPKTNSMEDVDLEEVFNDSADKLREEKDLTVNNSEEDSLIAIINQIDSDARQLLKPFLEKLSVLEFFETSEINDVLDDIHFEGNQGIQIWKKAIKSAVYYVDEQQYKQLTQL